jgi:protein ImuA
MYICPLIKPAMPAVRFPGFHPFMASVVSELREQVRRLADGPTAAWGTVSSGRESLDARLPAGGFRRGTLVEWMAGQRGAGATRLALDAARAAMGSDLPLVIVDRAATFFPPALPADLDHGRLLLVRCRRGDEADWACRQALRTSGVGAVLTWVDAYDERRLRGWQLSAEQSGALGLVVRCLPRQPEACFSDVRILVTSILNTAILNTSILAKRSITTPSCAAGGRRVRLELIRTRQGRPGAAIEVSLDDDAHPLPAAPAVGRRAFGS